MSVGLIRAWGFSAVLWAAVFPAYAATVETVTAESRQVPEERFFDGVIEAVNQSTVSSQMVGRIVEINYDVDDFVEKGAVILRFRSTEQKARLDQAEAGLKEAQARYQEASDEYTRVKDIYAKKLVSKAELDKAAAAFKAANARLDAAKGKLAEAKEQMAHTEVRAPYPGFVTKRHVEVGETVGVGQPLMTGLSLESLRAAVQVPQAFVNALRNNGKARVILPGDNSVDAAWLRIYPYADAQGHSFTVRVGLPDGQQGIYPGMFVKVGFVTGEDKRLLIPAKSVVQRSEVTAVYVVDPDGHIGFRQIRVGRHHGDEVEVLAGLDAGEQVATDPINAGIQLKQQGR